MPLQFARMFFRAEKKRKLIADNRFAEVTAKAVVRRGRLSKGASRAYLVS
jgi:hypothetical protein